MKNAPANRGVLENAVVNVRYCLTQPDDAFDHSYWYA